VTINFSYDVPVKLYSSHLLLLAVFLILPDLRRLASLLVLNRPTEPARIEPLFQRKWLRLASARKAERVGWPLRFAPPSTVR